MTSRANKLVASAALATAIVVGFAGSQPVASSAPIRASAPRAIAMPRRSWSPPRVATWPGDAGFALREELDGSAELAEVEPYDAELGPLATAIIEAVCGPAARALCAARHRCGCARALDGDLPLCERAEHTSCEDWVRFRWSWVEEEPDANVVLDADALRGCVARLSEAASSCGRFEAVGDCERLLVANARAGERCPSERGACLGGTCDGGVCTALPRAGEPCRDWECAPGASCEDDRCVSPAEVEARCASDAGCALDFTCLDGSCRARRGIGGMCASDSHCAFGTRCEEGRCVLAERCDLEHGCGDRRTCAGEEAARCLRLPGPTALEGEVCDAGCARGLFCSFGVCAALPRASEPCPRGVCADELRCTGTSAGAICTRGALHEGELCMSAPDAFCAPGLDCVFEAFEEYDVDSEGAYRCRARLEEGADCSSGPCDVDLSCVWGVLDGACEASICEPLSLFDCGEG